MPKPTPWNDPKMVDLDRLRDWMDAQGLGSGEIKKPLALAGGTQNLLLHFERAGQCYVLRRPPLYKRQNSDETMRREARVLAAIADTDVPHPRFIAVCDDFDVIGAVFYLMQPIDGFNVTVGMPELHKSSADIRRQMGLSMVDGIAALGRVDYQTVGLEGFGKPEGFLERQVPRWLGQLQGYLEFDGYDEVAIPHVEPICDWLQRYCPNSFSPGIMHGDYHLANVMFSNDKADLAAIVDWELCTIGDPLVDLGWMLATWPEADGRFSVGPTISPWDGFPTGPELVQRYSQGSERNLDAIDWYTVMACLKVSVIIEGSYARACAGKMPVEVGDYLHAAAVGIMGRAKGVAGVS